jgi:RNA polymerase sigma factor (sigma-70 family)
MLQGNEGNELYQRLLIGDQQALVELVRGYAPQVWAIASRILDGLGDDADVDEVTWDVFTYVWSQVHAYDPARVGGVFTRWVNQVAKWRSLAARRRLLRESARYRDLAETGPSDDTDSEEAMLDRLEAEEQHDALQTALAALSPPDRLLVELYYGEGVPLPVIAEQLAITPAAARQRLHRARGRLQRAGAATFIAGMAR